MLNVAQVVATGNGTWNETAIASYNLNNPAYRDTFTVPKGGWAAIRFKVRSLCLFRSFLCLFTHVTMLCWLLAHDCMALFEVTLNGLMSYLA